MRGRRGEEGIWKAAGGTAGTEALQNSGPNVEKALVCPLMCPVAGRMRCWAHVSAVGKLNSPAGLFQVAAGELPLLLLLLHLLNM